jgi:hypothetical protein
MTNITELVGSIHGSHPAPCLSQFFCYEFFCYEFFCYEFFCYLRSLHCSPSTRQPQITCVSRSGSC